MNFVKRGFMSIKRRKGKSLILFLVVFILGNVIAGSIAIEQATSNVEQEVKKQLGAKATVEIDYEKAESDPNFEYKSVPLDVIKEVAGLSQVKYYDYNAIDTYSTNALISYEMEEVMIVGSGTKYSLKAKGVNYAPLIDIEEGLIQLEKGRTFTDAEIENGDNVVMISKEVAEANNVTVDDTIVIDNHYYSWDNQTQDASDEPLFTQEITAKVIGIFSVNIVELKDSDDGLAEFNKKWMDTENINTLYFPNEFVLAKSNEYKELLAKTDPIVAEEIEGYGDEYSSVFILNSPEEVEEFIQDATPFLPEYYKVSTSQDQYEQIGGSMESLAKLSRYVLIIAVVASIVILTLVIVLFIRDRKKEMGIYLSLGEKKSHLILQIVMEVVIVALIAMVISIFTGNIIAKNISNTLINNAQSSIDDSYYYSYSSIGTDYSITEETVKSAYSVKLSAQYILAFFGLGSLTVIISTILPMLYITRLNPKKIMM